MKTFILISSLSLTTLFIALPITNNQDSSDRPGHRLPHNDDSADNESSPNPSSLTPPLVASKINKFISPIVAAQLAISETRFIEVTKLCINYCQLARACNKQGHQVPSNGGYVSLNEQTLRKNDHPNRRLASDHTVTNLSVPISPACVSNSRSYDVVDEEQIESANLCKERALHRLSTEEDSSFAMETGEDNCCERCVTKMNAQYRLSPECGEKLEKLILCLKSSLSCTTLQWYFNADRKRIRHETDPDYPCRECVEAFEYSCGKG